ncbi:hypothetical protein [Actinoplanes sp. NPDC049265]|uniref:hypothetical protein n=1 Tax=Actinoplanes sp. NPDC049265 TaxID=3363902 RepID=UPI003724821E
MQGLADAAAMVVAMAIVVPGHLGGRHASADGTTIRSGGEEVVALLPDVRETAVA